jgi:hypothetical protein
MHGLSRDAVHDSEEVNTRTRFQLFTANDFSQHVFYSLCILGFMALEKILAFFLILRNILEEIGLHPVWMTRG